MVTQPATALGLNAFSANGTIHPHGLFTTYYFEYGPTDTFGSKTAAVPLPPRLAAYYHESFDEGQGGWDSWLKPSHHKEGGVSGGFMRFAEPSGHDNNHVTGIMTVHLVKWLYPGMHPGRSPSVYLGGGDGPDFRGAKIAVSVRGNDFKPNGTELLWWTQSQLNPEVGIKGKWLRPNWAYTGFFLTDALLDGKWHNLEYTLVNDTRKWTYTGGTGGYVYGSIDTCQRSLNIDLFHMLAYVDMKTPPTGAIDFDNLTMTYRNYSVLLPSNGGKLVSSPAGGDDPARLSDGWRHGKDRAWRSAANPKDPQEFVWSFERPVTIDTVQLHQNPDWPAKDVEVLSSIDGKTFTPLVKKTLPEKGVPNANWAFTRDANLKTSPASALKVRMLSGYKADHWGLGEVEIFGTGAVLLPDNEVYDVNTDIINLTKGATYHYRLVAESKAGMSRGPTLTFTVPADQKPLAETSAASRITATTAKLEGRTNAMSLPTTFHFEYGPDAKYGSQTLPMDAGTQFTPRTSYVVVSNLKAGTKYHYRIVAKNAQGTTYGLDATLQTPAK